MSTHRRPRRSRPRSVQGHALALGAVALALLTAGAGATGTGGDHEAGGEPATLPPAASAAEAGPCTGDVSADGEALARLVDEANEMATDHSISLRPGCVYRVPGPLVIRGRPGPYEGALRLRISGDGAVVERPVPSGNPARYPDGVSPSRVFDLEARAALDLIGLSVRGGRAPASDGGGGGIRVGPVARLHLERTVLTGNRSPDAGAALAVYGDAQLVDVTIERNRSGPDGSAVHVANRARFTGVTVSANRGDGGAAVRNTGLVELVRSTFSGNTGFVSVVENTAKLRMAASTVAANQGAGLLDRNDAAVFSSLVVGNTGVACAGDSVPFVRSLASDDSCNGTISSATLGSLRHNGGPTRTMALRHGSSGVNPGDCPLNSGFSASDMAYDQRGALRDAQCDIGAFERVDEDKDGYDDHTEIR